MKRMIFLTMLISIAGTAMAQRNTPDDKVFEIPDGFVTHRFSVDLGKGNTAQLELTDLKDLARFENIDSLLGIFLADMRPFKDSLGDDLASKRIDYVTDRAGRKRVRIQTVRQTGSSFLIRGNEISALRASQDTVNMVTIIAGAAKPGLLRPFADVRYCRISFFINQLSSLKDYVGTGLGEKIAAIPKVSKSKWKKDKNDNWHVVKGDQDISAKNPGGMMSGSNDYISSRLSANAGNYKNYFIPSVSIGLDIVFNTRKTKNTLGLAWEPNFVFAKNAFGSSRAYRNDFLTLSFSASGAGSGLSNQYFHLDPNFSLSRLVKRRGDYFDERTFRLGEGQFSFADGKLKMEPGIYFTDFFKHATPGIKLSFSF